MRDTAAPGRLNFFRMPERTVMPIILPTATVKCGFPSPAQDFMEEDINLVTFLGMDTRSNVIVRPDINFCQKENLPANCYLVVNTEMDPISQDMLLVELNGEQTVRTIVKTKAGYTLHSPNPYISPTCHKDMHSFHKMGVVTQIIIDRIPAQAGRNSTAAVSEEIDLVALLDVYKPSVFLMRAEGDSMKDKDIPDNSYLVVDRSLEPKKYDVVIACLNGGFTVKTLLKSLDKWILYPGNPCYPPIPVQPEDDFMVWGVVSKIIIDRKSLWKRLQ